MAESTLLQKLLEPTEYCTLGYTGHIPGWHEKVGGTYGHFTTQLLHEATSTTGPSAKRPAWPKVDEVQTERPSWLGRIFDGPETEEGRKTDYLAGYAGYVADVDDIFGKQYRYPCRPEFRHFPRPRHVYKSTETCLRRTLPNDAKQIKLQTPPCQPDAVQDEKEKVLSEQGQKCRYVPPTAYYVSPYDLPCDDESKYFPKGYAGFVPYAFEFHGLTAPQVTRHAMNRFACRSLCKRHPPPDVIAQSSSQRNRLTVRDGGQSRHVHDSKCCQPKPRHEVYPTDIGMTVHYAGHIPGYRWRCGAPFGRVTRDCKAEFKAPASVRTGKCQK